MPTSDDDLRKKQEHVQKLRQQLAAAEASRVSREVELANDVTAAQLDAEAARLEADLGVAKDMAKASNVRSAAAAPLDAARNAMKAELSRGEALEAARAQRDELRTPGVEAIDPGQRLADATAEANAALPAGVPAETRIPDPEVPEPKTTAPKSTSQPKEVEAPAKATDDTPKGA
jgi:hypothetical protein